MANKATTDQLDELHGLLAKKMKSKLDSGDFTASDLNVIRAFLKDNGVEAPALPGTPTGDLASTLPFAGDTSYPN